MLLYYKFKLTKSIIIVSLLIFVILTSLYNLDTRLIGFNNDSALITMNENTNLASNEMVVNSKVTDIPAGWSYQQLIMLNPATEQTNYQVKVILTAENFDYALAKSDGSDIRFQEISDNPLSYWIETWNLGGESIIWVKIPSIGTDRFYINYGNPSATSESNGDDTFEFFDDFSSGSLNPSKWSAAGDAQSTFSITNGILHLTSAVPDYHANGVSLGFGDMGIMHGQTYGVTMNYGIRFAAGGVQTLDKSDLGSDFYSGYLSNDQWFVGDIRWVSDSLAQFNNGSYLCTATNSSTIPSGPLCVQLAATTIDWPLGYNWGALVNTTTTWGQGYAVRLNSWAVFPSDASNEVKCDWILVRKCIETEPAVTVVKNKLMFTSPEVKNYPGPMQGHYPASYSFESDQSFPYVNMTRSGMPTLSGQPPEGWIPHYPGQYGAIRVLDEYMGHAKVVELRKSRGTYGRASVSITKYFPTSATAGTIEFWFNKDSDTGLDATKFMLLGTGGSIEFGIENQALYNGTYPERDNIAEYVFPKNTWKHLRVDFDISQGGWQIQLDETWYGSGYTFPFINTPTEITGFQVRSHGTEFQTGLSTHQFFLDALGYSWDPFYEIGDNLNEGILLDFDPITQSRTDWQGYYPASEGYDEIPQGGQPDNWGYWQGGSSGVETIPAPEMYVLDSKLDGYGNVHNKILYCQDNSGGTIFYGDGMWDEPVSSGTVEFWCLVQNNQYGVGWGLLAENTSYEYTVAMGHDATDTYFRVYNVTTAIVSNITMSQNKWYRFSVDFSDDGGYAGLAPHTYRVRWYDSDGKTLIYASPDVLFRTNGSSSAFRTGTGDSTHANMHFDALGFSWDPNYNLGDNRIPAVYEDYEFAGISWIGYSLDGQPNITISGATTMKMPAAGIHTIQLYLNDTYGNWYNSTQTFFTEASFPSISGPNDFSMNFGDPGYSILWSVSGSYPANYTIYKNGTVHKTGNWTDSVILSLYGLEEGLHNFTVVCSNQFGVTASDEVWVTVLSVTPDITPPTISSPDNITFEEGSIGYSITWVTSDDRSPHWATVIRDTTLIYSQIWIGNDIKILLDGLTEGTYMFNCTLEDKAGNSAFDIVYVTVTPFVVDINLPSITSPSALIYEVDSVNNTLDWICNDQHPYAYQISKDGEILKYAPWHGENISFNVDGLAIGTYEFNLTLWDLSGNNAFDVVQVIVIPLVPDTTPPTVSTPVEQIISENMRGTITWEVYDEHPSICVIYRNGTVIYSQGYWSSGLIQYSFVSLPLGTWEFTLTVWDNAGNSASSNAIVKVLSGSIYDSTPPEISHPTDRTIIFGSTGNTIKFSLFDQHPEGYQVFIDYNLISEHSWSIPNIAVNVSVDGLGIGSYTIKIFAWDIYKNNETRMVSVTVDGDLTPPNITPVADLIVPKGSGSIKWIVSDTNPASYQIINLTDGTALINTSWDGSPITFQLNFLDVGEYHFRCRVYDVSGNFAMDDVKVTVVKSKSSPGFDLITLLLTIPLLMLFKKISALKRRFNI